MASSKGKAIPKLSPEKLENGGSFALDNSADTKSLRDHVSKGVLERLQIVIAAAVDMHLESAMNLGSNLGGPRLGG